MGEVVVLLGELPKPPDVVHAAMLRTLRAPNGDQPCAEGIGAALRWIGDRTIPFTQALDEAREHPELGRHVGWALEALGLGSGDGDGYGYGYGYGDGSGYGYGYGDGSGSGSGSGYGYGDGSGDGYGSGYGYGYGDGSGYGSGAAASSS